MKECVFTICTKSYIGLAQVLENSLKKHNPDLDFFIFISDSRLNLNLDIPSNIFFVEEIFKDKSLWEEMTFKYELVEFCTSIKPFCFDYLLTEKKYDKVIYTY